MKQLRKLICMAMTALMGAAMTSCSGDEAMPAAAQGEGGEAITLTTTVSMGDGGTRALTADGKKTFVVGDRIAVKYWSTTKNWDWTTAKSEPLAIEDIADGGRQATITVTLNSPDPAKTEVRYIYPASLESEEDRDAMLEDGQDGTLTTLASKFDYAEAEGSLTYSGGEPRLPGLVMQNKLAIARFTVSDGTNDITKRLTGLVIDDGKHTYNVHTVGAGEIWVALYPIGAEQTIRLMANDNDAIYEKSVTGKALAANNIYPIGLTMPTVGGDRTVPLTLEAKDGAATVTFSLTDEAAGPVEYRTCTSGTWAAWAAYTRGARITLPAKGDKVCFRGMNATYDGSNIACTAACYLYGNVMSLIDGTAYPMLKKLTEERTFKSLFNGNKNIYNHDTRPLLLPATQLEYDCYSEMFQGCSSLTKAPALPATEMKVGCYSKMFDECTSLTEAPLLPATSLEDDCYSGMFRECKNLKSLTCLATEMIGEWSISYMLYYRGNGGGTIYVVNPEDWKPWQGGDGEYGIPNNWKIETYVP